MYCMILYMNLKGENRLGSGALRRATQGSRGEVVVEGLRALDQATQGRRVVVVVGGGGMPGAMGPLRFHLGERGRGF